MKDRQTKEEIRAMFDRVRARHPKLVNIPPVELDHMIDAHESFPDSDVPLYTVTICALFSIGSIPFILHWQYEFVKKLVPLILSNIPSKPYFETNAHANFASLLLFIAIPTYLFNLHNWGARFLGNKALRYRRIYETPVFDKTTVNFWAFAGVLLMGWIFIPIMYATAFNLVSDELAKTLFEIYLMLTAPIVALLPTACLMFVMIIFHIRFDLKTPNEHFDLIPGVVVCKAILLLDYIANNSISSPSSSRHRRRIGSRISEISILIRRLGEPWGQDQAVDRFTRQKFEQAARSVLSLKLAATLPDAKSTRLLQLRVASIANIFITGNLRDLPTIDYELFKQIEVSKRIGIVTTALSLVGLGLFLALPLLAWALLVYMAHPTVDETVRPLLPILYSIWCVVGVLSTAERLAPEARTMISETIKLLLSRK